MVTTWSCDWCDASGTIKHEESDTVWNIARAILDAHRTAQPLCRASAQHVRARLTPRIPKEAVARD